MLRTILLLACVVAAIPAAAAETYLFTNGTLLTMTEDGARRADLRVVDQRIAAIAPSLEAAPNDVVVDLAGGYVMPGLAEMHAHVPAPAQGARYRDDVLFLWVANGITTARGMLGHPEHLTLRQELAAHEVLGPRLITSGPSFNGDSIASASHARQMVRDQHAAGYDFLKIHPGVTLDEYDALADEARRMGIPFAGHVPADVGLRHAVAAGQATIDHLDGFMQALVPDEAAAGSGGGSLFGMALASAVELARLPDLLSQMRQHDTWLVPTETLIENFAAADAVASLTERAEVAYLPPELRQRYVQALAGASLGAGAGRRALSVRKDILAAAHDAGVGILLGSDSPQIFNVPGFSIHRELESMVAAGLSPLDALHTGTTAPAAFFGRAHDFGSLAVGMAADLVVLSDDPSRAIANTRRIQGVMVRGRWLDRAALDAGLAAIAARYSQPP